MLKPPQLDLEVTVVSGKHLKNVNWRNGDLKPYAVAYLHPESRCATKTDDAGPPAPCGTSALPLPPDDDYDLLILNIDVFHSKPSEAPKPLVGTARFPLKDLLYPADGSGDSPLIRTLELRRPSGWPHGKIRIKVSVQERPPPPPHPPPPESLYHYQVPPPSGYYYPSARDYCTFSPPLQPLPPYGHHHGIPPLPSHYPPGSYSNPYLYGGYYSSSVSGYNSKVLPPPMSPPARPYYERVSGYVASPSAQMEYSSGPSSSYDHRTKGARTGFGTGSPVGLVVRVLGGLTLEERPKHNERLESDFAAKGGYGDHRSDY